MLRQNKNNAYCIVRRRASREDHDAGIRAAFIELSVHLDLSPHLPYLVNLTFTPVVGGVKRVPVIVASTAAGLERGFIAVGGLLYGEITLLLGES
jgi:hypothetical protein